MEFVGRQSGFGTDRKSPAIAFIGSPISGAAFRAEQGAQRRAVLSLIATGLLLAAAPSVLESCAPRGLGRKFDLMFGARNSGAQEWFFTGLDGHVNVQFPAGLCQSRRIWRLKQETIEPAASRRVGGRVNRLTVPLDEERKQTATVVLQAEGLPAQSLAIRASARAQPPLRFQRALRYRLCVQPRRRALARAKPADRRTGSVEAVADRGRESQGSVAVRAEAMHCGCRAQGERRRRPRGRRSGLPSMRQHVRDRCCPR